MKKPLINKLKNGLRGLLAVAILSSPIVVPDLLKTAPDKYRVIKKIGLNENEIKEVKYFKDSYRNIESWKILTHYYDPTIVRTLEFDDSSKGEVEFRLFSNCSFFRKKILGPEIGDKFLYENNYLIKKNPD